MACPFFAVVWTCEEAFNEAGPGVGGLICDECIDFCGGGRKADQIISRASDQLRFVGYGCGVETGFVEAGIDESVDRVRCYAFWGSWV
jgi:hypothetical protein